MNVTPYYLHISAYYLGSLNALMDENNKYNIHQYILVDSHRNMPWSYFTQKL